MRKHRPTFLFLAALLVFCVETPARALIVAGSASDVCPLAADPCTISETVSVVGGADLDFGTRTVEVVSGGQLDFGAGTASLR